MRLSCSVSLAVALVAAAGPVSAAIVGGGGSSATDCVLVLDIPGANKPAPPRAPKSVDCVDGDSTCDADELRNGECIFPLQVCANSSMIDGCSADTVNSAVVDHSVDNSGDPRFDVDFQALQSRLNGLGLPTMSPDRCTLSSSMTVKLRGPDSNSVMKRQKKILRITTIGATAAGDAKDVDKVKFTCRPEGDAVYLPTDLYTGTFDRIRKQVFVQSCALPTCHDSDTHQGGLILLPGSAYSNIVGVTPTNVAAAGDMLDRITPGDPAASFLYRKITNDLAAGYDAPMPYQRPALDPSLIELIRLWIIGDGTLGPAPETGWVVGTEQ